MRRAISLLTMAAALVQFAVHGPAASAAAEESFTIAVLPDTQNRIDTFQSQTQWLTANADDLNLAFVIHEGDLVEDLCDDAQWMAASDALHTLETAGISYAVVPGNHDVVRYPPCGNGHDYSQWDEWLPVSRAAGVQGYGGSMGGSSANSHYAFSRSGQNYVVVTLEFGPTQEALDWASGVLAARPDSHAIVVTHDMIGADGLLRGTAQRPGPSASTFSLPSLPGQLGGQDVWDQVVYPASSVIMTVSGHVVDCGGAPTTCGAAGVVGRSVAPDSSGAPVARMLANYQGLSGSSTNAYIRLLTFYPDAGVVQVRTYAPTLSQFMTGSDNQFFLDVPQLRGGTKTESFSDTGNFATETTTLRSLGVVQGNIDGTFRPSTPLSRQAAAAMIWRTLPGSNISAQQDCRSHGVRSRFSDVPDTSGFCWPINEMARMGLITGWPDGTFRPGQPVSRQALAAFLYDRKTSSSTYPFSDVGAGSLFASSIATAYSTGIINGYPDGTYHPADFVTRDATAAMLSRYYFWQRFHPLCLMR